MDEFKKDDQNQKDYINLNASSYSSTVTKEKPVQDEKSKLKVANIAKVFIWFGIGLLITGAIAIGLPNIFLLVNENNADAIGNTYIYLLIISAIGILPLSIIMAFAPAIRKNKVFIKVTYLLYTIFMGVLLSGLMLMLLALDGEGVTSISALNTFAYTFIITAGLFMLSGFIGVITKNMSKVYPLLITLVVGSLTLSLVNFFLRVEWLYWVIDFAMFFWILITTAVDMHNINKIAQRVDFNEERNLAIYLAYQLYVDFIYIFIRVLYYVLLASNRKK